MKKTALTVLAGLSTVLGTAALAATSTPAMKAMPGMGGHDMSAMSKQYVVYTPAAFEAAKGTQRVLFFHATWCPNCKAANADIEKNLANIPAGVTIFKTDYDTQTALKQKYGITAQHTFVLVDAQGNADKKWAGGGLKEIVAAAAAAKKM